MTSHGCRPISVTSQPASVAIQPEKVNPAKVHSSQRGGAAPLRSIQAPSHDSAIISMPMPTITRNAKNTGATGGVCGAKASRPFTSASGSCLRIRLAPFGISIAKSLRCFSAFGIANSTSGTPFSVFQIASIAAIFAGWCSSVLRPCRSPTKACTGASTAASTTPVRSVRSAAASPGALSSRHADSPATTNDGGEPGGEHHVREAVGEGGIEDHLPPVRRHQLAVGIAVAGRRLHPGIEREDPERRERGADRDQHGGGEMQPARHAVHAEQHDAEESRLQEERGQHLGREQRAGDVAHAQHEPRPVGAELERHDDAGDHAHREGEREDLDPQLVGLQPGRLAGARVLRAEIHQDPGEPDGDAREQDVKRDVEPELGPRKQEGVAGFHGESGDPMR